MDVQIFHEGVDITNQVISYDWEKVLCTGIGQLRLETTRNFSANLYDEVEIYEGGNKKGTFFVHTVSADYPRNSRTLSCQDASIKIQTYFIAETYFVDYPSTSDYWISKFLTDATVAYQYDGVSTGTLLNNNTTLGRTSAIDAITPLLQQNGWYLYFDANNVCHIGQISISPENPTAILTDSTITGINGNKHDKMFRNRVLVWGGTTIDGTWVFADHNYAGSYPNEYDGNDVRTTVIANSNIGTLYDANLIASRAINEFDKTNNEVAITVAGSIDLHLGDYLSVRTSKYNTGGMVTTIGSSLSSTGLTSNIVIGQRCPRLFAFYQKGISSDSYVYVGTDGAGIWRKPLKDIHTWENFSGGIPLDDRSITDLAIDNNVYACVTSKGNLYANFGGSVWSKFTPGDFSTTTSGEEITYPAASGLCVGCAIDKATGDIIGAYTISGMGGASWIYYITNFANKTVEQVVDENDYSNFTIVGIDNNGMSNIISVMGSGLAENYLWNNSFYNYMENQGVENTTAFLDTAYHVNNNSNSVMYEGIQPSNMGVCGDGKYLYVMYNYFISAPPYRLTSIQKISTKDGGSFSGTYWYTDGTYVESQWLKAMGDGKVVFLHYSTAAQTDGFYLCILDTATSYTKTEILLDGIPYDDRDIVDADLVVVNGQLRYYILTLDYNTEDRYYLYFYNLTTGVLHTVTQLIPYWSDGTPASASYNADLLINSDHIYITSDTIVLYAPTSTHQFTQTDAMGAYYDSVTGNLLQYKGDLLKGGDLYRQFYIQVPEDYYYFVYKYSKGIAQGNIYTLDYEGNMAGNSKKAYIVNWGLSSTNIIDLDTGMSVKDMTSISTGGYVAKEADETFPGLLFYSTQTGKVTKVLLSGVLNSITYNLNLTADFTDSFTADLFRTHVVSVFDSIYVVATTHKSSGGSWSSRRKYGILTPASGFSLDVLSGIYGSGITTIYSGERLIENDYSIFSKSTDLLMKGYKGAYSTVLETAMPHQVEISQPNVVSTYGNRSYSGLVISGVQTGWGYGEIWLSPTGNEDTYTRVLLTTLSGTVSDVRTFPAIVEVGGLPAHRTFCIYPQENELVLTNISHLTNTPTVIISSGTLNDTSYVMATFSGNIGKIETTNTQDVPYIFVSLAGEPSVFYQRDSRLATEPITEFIDRTGNLPTNEITVIRADDLI